MRAPVDKARGSQAWIVFLAFGVLSVIAGVTVPYQRFFPHDRPNP